MRQNRKGSVIVDVAVDRGVCVETTHALKYIAPMQALSN
ncbi:MAG: hypothetical protein WCH01_06795 [Methylococcaceae bacterium]